MELIPKAKPIRIRIVSGGEEHSSIESLRHNYSLGDILPLVKDGRLHKWLLRVGEKNAADSAYDLIGSNTNDNSRDMVELTASIFNTKAISIEELQLLWQKQYPKTFLNNLKSYVITFPDFYSARKFYDSIGERASEITKEEWRNIFETSLKRMPLLAVLEDFKGYKDTQPMNKMAWLKVLKHHANSVSDKELYLIAQAAYDDPYFKDEAVEWFQKSARSYNKAKEWVNKNVKKELDPKEKELFDAFESDPYDFVQRYFNKTYPQDLDRFLNALSALYRTNSKPIPQQIIGRGKYCKYLYIVDKLYFLNYRGDKARCLRDLKQLPNNVSTAYYFSGDTTLEKIVQSLEKDETIFGVRLSKLNYQQAILFIASLAKTELENEK